MSVKASIEGLGSIRTKKAPNKTIKAYKLMRLVDGELYPLFIDSSVPTKIGVWYDADSTNLDSLKDKEAGFYYLMSNDGDVVKKQSKKPTKLEVEEVAKKGLRYMYVKEAENKQRRYGGGYKQYYNVGINGSGVVSPTYAIRPGWHAGSLPTMRQIGKGTNKDKRDDSFVWTEVELSADIDYNQEAQRNPDKDIPDHIPTDGFYIKATNADKKKSQADLVGWYVAGAMKINRIISDDEAREIIDKFNEKHPNQKKVEYDYERESGKKFNADKMVLEGLGLDVHHNSPYSFDKFDLKYIGQGEGNQAHGYGIYVSVQDLKKYANTKKQKAFYKGSEIDLDDLSLFKTTEQQIIRGIFSDMKFYNISALEVLKKGIESDKELLKYDLKNKSLIEHFKYLYSLNPSDFKIEKRNHYYIKIPDNDGTNYIEEDKKLSKKVLNKVVKEFERRGWKYSNTKGGIYLDSPEGDDTLAINPLDDGRILYKKISSLNDFTPKKASELLHDAGFVGIHYFGISDGECYVIFNENDTKIVGHDLFGVSGIDEDFADKLNYFIENGYTLGNRYEYFSCGYANDILQACGLNPSIEIVITQNGMKKILGRKSGKKDNAHDLTPIEILRLPQLIQKPILVINGNTSDTRLIFVEIPRRGRKMFAVVDLDINLFLGKQGKYNLIASVYSQENYKIVEKIISASVLNNIHYYDSTKIKSWLSEAGQLQLLPTITTNSMFSEKDFPNGANIRKNDEDTNKSKEKSKAGKESKKQMKGIGKLSNTDKLDDLAETQYRNRMKARIPDIDDYTLDEVAGKIHKENEYTHIRYTQNDFFQVDLDNLNRVHEFIMYMKEFFVKKTHWWLDILRLDADGYPIYIDFKGAFVFIETYKQYKDEWKKDFFYGDSVDYFVKSQYVMSHGDNDFSNIIMKLNHKPSVKAICDFIEKTAKKNEFSEKFIKELKEHIEKMDSDAIINKMINAYKRAFSPVKPSVPVASDLYKYLDKSKLPNGEYRRTYSGIYYDDGYAVTTDGRFIFAHKKFYDKKNEGKIIDEIGKEIDGKYPNWRHFLLNESDKLKKLDIDRDELYKQILMYDKAYRYRDHKAPIEYFSIKDGDKIYPYSAKLLKGFLHQSMAYTNVSFYVSESTNEYNRLNNMLIMKSDEGSYGIAAQLGTDNHEEMLDEVNNYGMMRDFGADGYPFILYSVYETGKHSKEKTKPNNIQLAKAKMKMAAARLKMMNMSLGEITYEMD